MMFRVSFKGLRRFLIIAPSPERAKEWSERQLAHWHEDKATPVEIMEYDEKAEAKAERAEKKAEKIKKQEKEKARTEEATGQSKDA